jgi:hypothetical protein
MDNFVSVDKFLRDDSFYGVRPYINARCDMARHVQLKRAEEL